MRPNKMGPWSRLPSNQLHCSFWRPASYIALVDGGLEVASGFPYLAKLLSQLAFLRPAPWRSR